MFYPHEPLKPTSTRENTDFHVQLQTLSLAILGGKMPILSLRLHLLGFPCGTVVKNPPANAGDTG